MNKINIIAPIIIILQKTKQEDRRSIAIGLPYTSPICLRTTRFSRMGSASAVSVDVTKQLAGAVVGLNKDGARKLMLSSLVSFSRTSESETKSGYVC